MGELRQQHCVGHPQRGAGEQDRQLHLGRRGEGAARRRVLSINKRIKSINKKSKAYEIKFSHISNRCGQQAR